VGDRHESSRKLNATPSHFAWERGVELGKVVTTSDVEAALLDVVEAEDAHYTTLWESLSRAQRPLVQALEAEPTTAPYREAFRSRHQLGSAAAARDFRSSPVCSPARASVTQCGVFSCGTRRARPFGLHA
jgi:hypothetical protein